MQDNELVKFERGVVQKVSNTISIANKLLAVAEPQLIPYRKKDKWGFCTPDKKIVIDCQYDYANPFTEGVAWVKDYDNKSEYFIDREGNTLIKINLLDSNYNIWENFSNGLALVEKEHLIFGYIDKKGENIVPCIYELAESFSDGLALVNHDRYYGYIERNGDTSIPFIYDYATSFREGIAIARKNGKEFFIDKSGYEIFSELDSSFNLIGSFSEGLVRAQFKGKYGFINKDGEIVIPYSFDHWLCEFSEGLAKVRINEKFGYVNKNGNIAVPCSFETAESFSDGLARIKKSDRYGFINKKGDLAIPCVYEYASSFSNGLSKICMKSRTVWEDGTLGMEYEKPIGYINNQGIEYWED